jgi:hypothetical protein
MSQKVTKTIRIGAVSNQLTEGEREAGLRGESVAV